MDFASLIVLSYNRQEMLQRSLESLFRNTHYPYELIILDDGSNRETQDYIYSLVQEQKVSTALFNCGRNLGIGVQLNRGARIARGNILAKLDADLEYQEGWLTECVQLLSEHPEIGCLGLFKYWHPPCYFPEELIEEHADYYEVTDFVGSAILFRREIYNRFGPWTDGGKHIFSEDVYFKRTVQENGYKMALPLDDLCRNFGFGEHLTSLIRKVDWEGGKHEYNVPYRYPLLFGDVSGDGHDG